MLSVVSVQTVCKNRCRNWNSPRNDVVKNTECSEHRVV